MSKLKILFEKILNLNFKSIFFNLVVLARFIRAKVPEPPQPQNGRSARPTPRRRRSGWRRDTQPNDTQPNDTQHNWINCCTQHIDTLYDSQMRHSA